MAGSPAPEFEFENTTPGARFARAAGARFPRSLDIRFALLRLAAPLGNLAAHIQPIRARYPL